MLYIFKDLKIIYYIVSGLLGVVLAFLLISMNVNEILAVVIIALWIFLNSIIFNRIAGSKAASINALRDSCNVNGFINEYAKLLPQQKEGSSGDALVRLNMAAGYMDLGEIQKAFDVMGRIKLPDAKYNNFARGIAAVYHNNFSLAFLKAGEYNMARSALDSCKKVIMDDKFPPTERDKFMKYCALREAQLDIVTGNEERIDSAEKIFLDHLNSTNTLREKVSSSYWLARIKYMMGDREGERSYLNYAYANGGDTIYRSEAEKILFGSKEASEDLYEGVEDLYDKVEDLYDKAEDIEETDHIIKAEDIEEKEDIIKSEDIEEIKDTEEIKEVIEETEDEIL